MDAVAELVRLARQTGIPDHLADRFGQAIRQHYAGDRIYVPAVDRTRDDRIRQEATAWQHDPTRYERLSRRHQLSERRIRQIVDG